MSSKLKAGQLVEVGASAEAFDVPAEWRKAGADAAVQAGGQKGQLTEFDEETGKWTVATFGASMVSVKEELLRPLATEDVADFDLALGPASNSDVMGQELTDWLARKGHVLCKLFVAPEDLTGMLSTADRCVEEGAFTRLASELEPGYLGKDGSGKTLSIDMEGEDTADFVKDSPLRIVEDAISTVGLLLRPFCESEFGFDIYSRSNSMLALPFDGDEDAYTPPDLENEDASSFLSMMWRAKLQVIVNAGPASAQMTMIPKLEGDVETTVTVQPGMLAIFCTDRYRFSYEPAGKALMIASWYLDQPKDYVISDVQGDLSYLSGGASGPPHPNVRRPVPIVSLSERYAFGVDEPWKLWHAYAKAGWDTAIKHPFQRWDCDIYYAPDADQTSGLSYTQHGGFSDGIELFDCRFFDISPAEAKGMDPTQRQVLEVSYVALQGAGWTKKMLQMKPANIAAFVGLDKNEWNSIPKDIAGGFGASSSANAITSNRFNYCMNLKGASMTIDTACSASLVCTHTGKLYLLHDEYDACEAVVVCGVNLSMSPFTYIGGCGAGMHSHIGRCFTYNSSADGYMRGEATAAIAIKSKPFEPEKGDFALMAGSQVNQDGRSASLTAPNGPSQERCERAVIKEVRIKAREIDTTECHGTGTSLGDPIEIGAVRKVQIKQKRIEPLMIASSKSNFGHLEGSAAGIAMNKCVMVVIKGVCAPTLHFKTLNPHLDHASFDAIFISEHNPYKFKQGHCQVSSFGVGGTNGHAIFWGRKFDEVQKDFTKIFLRKMLSSPPPIVQDGSNPADWDFRGLSYDAQPGEKYTVTFFKDDVTGEERFRYERQEDYVEPPEYYCLTGSFNDWGEDRMMETDAPNVFYSDVNVPEDGSVEFRILAEGDLDKVIAPATTTSKCLGTQVVGPAKDLRTSWIVKGEPGANLRVELLAPVRGPPSVMWFAQLPEE